MRPHAGSASMSSSLRSRVGLRHRLATAYDAAPCRVRLDELLLALEGGEVEVVRHAADGVPIGAFDELNARLAQELLHALGNRRCACDAGGLDSPIGAFDELNARLAQELLHALGNRRCACDAGGLDSCGVEQTRRGLGGFDEEVVRFLKYGAAPCEGADDAAGIQVWYELARAGEQGLHIAGVRVLVVSRSGTSLRAPESRASTSPAYVSLSPCSRISAVAVMTVLPCTVPVTMTPLDSLLRAVDGRYRSAAHEGGSVGYGVLGCGDGDFERIDIAGGGAP